MRPRRSGFSTSALLTGARIQVSNRYAFDYACEDEYFDRELTLLEARKLPLPTPVNFKYSEQPTSELYPLHWNDVRFNYKPENKDRRQFRHDHYFNTADLCNGDYLHEAGYEDEDWDYEVPDPEQAMHYNMERNPVVGSLYGLVFFAICVLFPTMGLRLPQKDNPFYWRKKFATPQEFKTMQDVAMLEYGGAIHKKAEDTSVMMTNKGF